MTLLTPFLLATWFVTGGTERFGSFLKELAGTAALKAVPSVAEMPFERPAAGDVFFVLPDYAAGARTVPEVAFDRLPALRDALRGGCAAYFENYETPDSANDGLHADLQGLQTLGGPRQVFHEYFLFGDRVMQGRVSSYLPAKVRGREVPLAHVSDCIGTHRETVKGKMKLPVVAEGLTPRVVGAAMDLSCFDPLYGRPLSDWRNLFSAVFSRVTGRTAAEVAAAFDRVYRDPVGLSGPQPVASAVARAIDWHAKSGLLRTSDGRQGLFELIRSSTLEPRRILRTDAGLITAALYVSAGKKYGRRDWYETGMNLADFLFAHGIQEPGGFYRWFVDSGTVWSSDSGRSALSVINLYKTTGEKRFLSSARKLAEAYLKWIGDERICCGFFKLSDGYTGQEKSDNPVYYGEMVAFLLQLGEVDDPKWKRIALEIIDRVMAKFPDVSPFGFSDNFTYSRGLLMLATAQYSSDRDYSVKINLVLDFLMKYRDVRSGGIAEAQIRLLDHNEAGVGMGDGSDLISDILYCDNFAYAALSVLAKLPVGRRGTIDWEKVETLHEGLRRFFVEKQIRSDDPRLDGGWMRAFDMAENTYYGLDKDLDWGAYCIMAGWTNGFIPLVLMHEDDNECFYLCIRSVSAGTSSWASEGPSCIKR